jgi:basic membrane protein A
MVFGSNADQNDIAPEVTLGSVVIDLPHAFLAVAREVNERRFIARVIELGAASDVVKLVFNPARENSIPIDVRRAVDSVARSIKSGAFHPTREHSPK